MNGNKTVHSELNGCVVKSELLSNGDEDQYQDERNVLGWHAMTSILLPGSSFSGARKEVTDWFTSVLELSDINQVQKFGEEAKLKFLAYSKKLSDSYQNAMARGIDTEKGAILIEDCSRYRTSMKQAATEVANEVINSLFEAGMN